MTFLAHLADFLALFGFALGVWRWKRLETCAKWLTLFFGASCACGYGQSLLFSMGYQTAWAGNLWDLSLLCLFIPACFFRMRRALVQYIRPLLTVAIGLWIAFNVAAGDVAQFDNYLSMSFYGLLGLVGATMLSQFLDDSLKLLSKPGFIMGLVALSVGLVDALLSLALSHYSSLSQPFLVGLMVFRNAVWCLAYAVLTYSLFLKGSKHEPNSKRDSSIQPAPRHDEPSGRWHRHFGGDGLGWEP